MSLHPDPSWNTHSRPTTKRPGTRSVEGLDGPVELRQMPAGYWQVWPRPTPESLRSLYGDEFYEVDKSDYLAKMERDRAYWDATWSMRRTLMERALPASRRRILDVGSSGGFLLDHFQQAGWQTFGIEPSRSAAAFARERYGLAIFCGELLDFRGSDSAHDDDGPAAFDVIHSAQVLEHVLDPEACVAHMASLLAPGGLVYLEVPNDFNVFQETARERLDKDAWWVAPRYHLNYFGYESLSRLLASHGLEEIDRLASFPIEIFLLMGDDYVGDPELGSSCHERRMNFERSLIETDRIEPLLALYRSLAKASVGRTCGILARKSGG